MPDHSDRDLREHTGHRRAPIDLSPEELRRAGHRLVDVVVDLLARMPDGPVTRDESPSSLRQLLGERALPVDGTDATTLLESAAKLLFEHSLFNGHPRFLGYVTAPPAPIGILGELLAAAVNPNVGAYRLAPIASEIEAQTLRWIAELVGFPIGGGLLVSGGNMANVVALLAARRASAPWDVRKAGVGSPDRGRLRVYASEETHTWIHKATDMAGLGTDAIHRIPVHRAAMSSAALRAAIREDRAKGEIPMMVVANAGTVSTGAVDPLSEIADVCAEAGVWMHVDGCYGGFAARAPGAPEELRALSRADSLALDPHKWLYAPLEAGALLVRDPDRLRDAFAYHPPYYHFGEEVTSYVDLGPQNSRGFRALKVWLALQHVGRDAYLDMIADDMRLSRWMAREVDAHPALERVTQSLSVTTFRYVPPDLGSRLAPGEREPYVDRLQRMLLDRVQRSGEAFVSNAVVDGRYVLRACIVNFRTTERDLAAVLQTVVRIGAELDASGAA